MGRTITGNMINAMRGWLADCEWPDLTSDQIWNDLTDDTVIRGVDAHFEGGLEAFLATMNEE